MTMPKKRSEIDRFILQSDIKEILENLQEMNVTDIVVAYIDPIGKARISGTTDLVTALGLCILAEDMLKNYSEDEDE